jgi:hypothetical protein
MKKFFFLLVIPLVAVICVASGGGYNPSPSTAGVATQIANGNYNITYTGSRENIASSNTDSFALGMDVSALGPESPAYAVYGTNTVSSTKGDFQVNLASLIGEFIVSRGGYIKWQVDMSNSLDGQGNAVTNIAKVHMNASGGVTNASFSFVMRNSGTNYLQFVTQTNVNGACQTNLIPVSTR